jgi:hypothetical protein
VCLPRHHASATLPPATPLTSLSHITSHCRVPAPLFQQPTAATTTRCPLCLIISQATQLTAPPLLSSYNNYTALLPPSHSPSLNRATLKAGITLSQQFCKLPITILPSIFIHIHFTTRSANNSVCHTRITLRCSTLVTHKLPSHSIVSHSSLTTAPNQPRNSTALKNMHERNKHCLLTPWPFHPLRTPCHGA